MKIIFVASSFGKKDEMSFGPNPLIYNIVKGVSEKEEVVVLAGRPLGKPSVEVVDGIKVLRVFSHYPQFLGKSPFLNIGFCGLSKVLAEKPDHVNSQDFDAAVLFRLLNFQNPKIVKSTAVKSLMQARLSRIPESEIKRFSPIDKAMIGFQSFFEGMCLRNSDFLITQSKNAFEELMDFYPGSPSKPFGVSLISNGVDCGLFKPLKEVSEEQRLFFAGGCDVSRKGANVFYNVFCELKHEFPELKATVVGSENAGKFEYLLQMHKCLQDVKFVKRAPYSQMPVLLNESSIVLMPSLHETFGNVAAEGMACGKAVVASDCTALPEVVGDAGVLAITGSCMDFIEKTRDLLNNGRKRVVLGKKARNRVLENFTVERTVNGYLDFFHGWKDC